MLHATRSSRPDTLDRSVLVVTLCVWGAHFLLRSTLFYFTPDHAADLGTLTARAIASATGAVVCLCMYVLLRRCDGRDSWRLLAKAIALSVPASVALTWLGEHAFLLLSPYYRTHPELWMHPGELVPTYLGYQWMLLTWCALYVGATTILQVRLRDAQLAAAHSAAQQAQLMALRLQINPHFLFNTLNTLAGLIVLGRRDESERIVLNLSRFLRHTLARTPSQFATLADEIDMLRMYLDIESARFGDRLKIRYDIAPACEQALVPSLVLLPLAENSVKHALDHAEDGIEIRIGARREDGTLSLWLEDEGAPAGESVGGLGIGLSNIRQQLVALYGTAATLHAGPTPRGWCNRLRLPWREASE